MTHYLRFPDEATAITVLADYRTEEDTWITASHGHALDVIGEIAIGGEYDKEGNVVTAPTVLDGWHVNFMGELLEDWADYVVSPEQPVRVFF